MTTPPRMTAITQGFLDPKVRDWLYTIALAVGPLLIGKEAMERDEWELWLAVVGSILVPGVARMNIDYSLGGRKPGKREAGRAIEYYFERLDNGDLKITGPQPYFMPAETQPNVVGLAETVAASLNHLMKDMELVKDSHRAINNRFDDLRDELRPEDKDGPEEPVASEEVVGTQSADEEPTVVYDDVRRAQELERLRAAGVVGEVTLSAELTEELRVKGLYVDPTIPPEHRP